MKTAIMWFRNDLRLHDNPALHAAVQENDAVLPIFIIDSSLMKGGASSSNRNKFLYESLEDVRQSLRAKDADLSVYEGNPVEIFQELLDEIPNATIYLCRDYTPFSRKRDSAVKDFCTTRKAEFKTYPGRLLLDSVTTVMTQTNQPYKVFTPFWKAWSKLERRPVAPTPQRIVLPQKITIRALPEPHNWFNPQDISPDCVGGGEAMGRKQLKRFIESSISAYATAHNDLGVDSTSRLSPYLHFGCVSPREIESNLPDNAGARAWHRQLAWRDFYAYILFHYPETLSREFQEPYRKLTWSSATKEFKAWQAGVTGYPVVDAAMRQLRQEGWMHNRARLISASFLTKDLAVDWRRGEQHFRRWLVDGDVANNVGNWQWISSVGVDPAPLFRRLYNPVSQQKTYDPKGIYVRKYVPELSKVPDEYITEPWKMSQEEQKQYNCIIDTDYPSPIIDHAVARQETIERYQQVRN